MKEEMMRNGKESEMSGRKSGVNRVCELQLRDRRCQPAWLNVHWELIFMSMIFAQSTLVDGVFEM